MSDRPLRIVHVHAARDNLGDELLTRVLREGLATRLAPREIEFVGVSSEEDADVRHTNAPDARARAKLCAAVAAADAAILGPGEVIGPFPAYISTAIAALSTGRPVLWAGVAGRIVGGRAQRWYLRQLLARASGVWVRDAATLKRLRGIVPASRLHHGVDLAFAWRPTVATSPVTDAIGLALRGPESADRPWGAREFTQVADILREHRERGRRIVLFSFLSREAAARIGSPSVDARFTSDDDVNDFLIERLGTDGIEVIRSDRDPQKVAEKISTLSLFVGMRLHSLAIASLCGTPFIALDYADKVVHLAEVLGAADRVVGPDDVGPRLPALMNAMLEEGRADSRGTRTRASVDALRAQAEAQLDGVAQQLREIPHARAGRVGQALAPLLLSLKERYRRA